MPSGHPRCSVLFLLLQFIAEITVGRPCIPKFLSSTAMVCVCNATYCDTMDPISLPPRGSFVKYTSSRTGQRLERREGTFSANYTGSGAKYTYSPFVHYQTIKGFGGALTDAAAINILQLSPAAQEHLLRSYFSEEGIEYNLLRFPIGCSDFSTRAYSYDDDCPGDFDLKCFRLAPEDLKYRIPLLHRFQATAKRPLSLVATPWTAPGWLKTNNAVEGKYRLKGTPGDRYHKTWANYLIRFLDEYAKHNISFWAITPQNEPVSSVLIFNKDFPTMPCSSEEQRDYIILDLGPALKASRHKNVLVIIHDDISINLLTWAKVILEDSRSAQYVDGISIHWYLDWIIPAGPILEATHHLFPSFFLLYTESCNGFLPWQKKVDLGSWERGETYSHSIITKLNSFVTGWIDWSLALDMQGGPSFVQNPVDSPVIVNAEKDEFYKQPMFYHLGHFSKFIPENSTRVSLTAISPLSSYRLQASGFQRPDGNAVVVVLNTYSAYVNFSILDTEIGSLEDVAPPNSIQTYLWTRNS